MHFNGTSPLSFPSHYESTNIYRVWIPYKKKVISAKDVLFDEDEFYNGKPIRFSAELINKLDEAIKKVEIQPDANLEDLQLRHDEANAEIDGENQEEMPKDINEYEKVEDEDLNPNIEKEQGIPQPTWESMIYPTPNLSLISNFLTNTDISLPVKSEGVRKVDTSFAVSTDEVFSDLPDLPDIEPAIIYELKRQ